ncbi:TolC family protein, partial [Burkholderia cenocepacia]
TSCAVAANRQSSAPNGAPRLKFEANRRYKERLASSSEQTLRLAELRYRGGVDSHLRYLDAQRQDFSNQLAVLDTWAALQNSRIALYKALGGEEQ